MFNDLINLNERSTKDAEIAIYRLCRVLFLLKATIIYPAQKYAIADPEFIPKLLKSLHVDDINWGSDDITTAYKFYIKSKQYLHEGDFNLRQFESNSIELEALVAEETFTHLNVTKVLVLHWDKYNDYFIFSFHELLNSAISIPTKRQFLPSYC